MASVSLGSMRAPESTDAAALRAFLAERDVPCPGCGYNLRGLTGAVCPECGAPLTMEAIRLSLRRSGGAPVVAAGVGLLMFSVFALPSAAFVLIMSAGMLLGSRGGRGVESALIIAGLGATGLLMFASPLLAARWWDRWEPRVAAMPRAVRWGIAALCWSWIVVPFGAIAVL